MILDSRLMTKRLIFSFRLIPVLKPNYKEDKRKEKAEKK
jgi:hypothetical protein